MSFHENRLPADDSHEYYALFVILEKLTKFEIVICKLLDKNNLYKRLFEMDILASFHCSLRINFNPSAPGKF